MPTNKHNIDAKIICNNMGILTAFEGLVPVRADSRLWNVEYTLDRAKVDDLDPNSDDVLIVHICFESEVDRVPMLASLRGSEGMFNSCEIGTYIRTTTNNHEYPIEERTDDDREFECGKDISGIYTEDFINGISQRRIYGTN